TTLDTTITSAEQVALLKIDVEGGEYQVLRGSKDTLLRCRPVIIFEAGRKSTGQYGVTPLQVFQLLEQNGYELTTMARWLTNTRPYSLNDFEEAWNTESDYYFLAHPKRHSATS